MISTNLCSVAGFAGTRASPVQPTEGVLLKFALNMPHTECFAKCKFDYAYLLATWRKVYANSRSSFILQRCLLVLSSFVMMQAIPHGARKGVET